MITDPENDKKIKDFVKYGSNEDVAAALSSLENKITALFEFISKNMERNESNFAYFNFLKHTAYELNKMRRWIEEPNDFLAWCTRNLFEINVLLRYAMKSDEKMKFWIGQLAYDQIQIFEGIIGLAEAKDENVILLEKTIAEIRSKAKLRDVILADPISMSKMASKEGLRSEYGAIYKLCCKFVHPSSWLINGDPANTQSWEQRNIFIIQAQIYANDSYKRTYDKLGISEGKL